MSRLFYHTMQDNAGNLLFGVTGTMRLAGTGTLATIYGDEALTVILPNPMTNHPSYGSFRCFLPTGDFDFAMAKAGYSFETLSGVQGYGTMAQQDAAAVAITGGTATGLSTVGIDVPVGNQWALSIANPTAGTLGGIHLQVADGTNRYNLYADGTAPNYLESSLRIGAGTPAALTRAALFYPKATHHGMLIRPTDTDSGGNGAISFLNLANTVVGSITTNGTTTAYNTTSDSRLKHDVADLTGELATVQALRPVRFRWNADDTPGVGFLAHEVAAHVAGVISGEPDAVEEDGRIKPQMIDASKLVPFLTGAVKTLAAQVEALTARLVVLEDALGV